MMPSSKIGFSGRVLVQHWRPFTKLQQNDPILDICEGLVLIHESENHNLVTDEGINHMLNVTCNGATQYSTWYVAPFEGNYTPVAGLTAATFPSAATECTAYDEATRQEWNVPNSTAKQLTSTASRAVFTFNASKTIYGIGVLAASGKSATTTVCMAAARFAAPRAVVDNDVLNIGYILNANQG